MAKINPVEDILKHEDDEIIEFLLVLSSAIKRLYVSASKENKDYMLWSSFDKVCMMNDVLKELDRRNKERSI